MRFASALPESPQCSSNRIFEGLNADDGTRKLQALRYCALRGGKVAYHDGPERVEGCEAPRDQQEYLEGKDKGI